MTWHLSGTLGAVPSWTCESCTAQKDKCCSLTMNLLSAYDACSKQQSLARVTGDQRAIARQLTPMMEAIERDCPHAQANVADKQPAAKAARTYYIDHGKNCKIWSDGDIETLTPEERIEFQREENEERLRTFSPHIGQ